MSGFIARHFGRITEAVKRAELIAEAERSAKQHAVKAIELREAALRLALDERHYTELADFYTARVAQLKSESTDPQPLNNITRT